MRDRKRVIFINKAYLRMALLLPAFLIIFLIRSAGAATFNVNSTLDLGDDNIGNGICHTSTGFCTLRAALDEANALGGSHTINLPAGTHTYYVGTSTGGSGLDVFYNPTVEIVGPSQYTTVLDGTSVNEPILTVNGTASISGVTFSNASHSSNGGAISNNGSLTLDSVTVTQNSTALGGGGIYSAPNSSLSITSSTISDNSAGTLGGGIFLHNGVTFTAFLATISANDANQGGGIAESGGTLHMTYSEVSGNTASYGGGIYALAAAQPFVGMSTISGNTATNHGGGIHTVSGDFELMQSTVSGNAAGMNGGGIWVGSGSQTNNPLLSLVNVTVSGNTANQNGGGIFILGNTGDAYTEAIEIANSTITDNIADFDAGNDGDGGGLCNDSGGIALMKNSILAGNDDASTGTLAWFRPDLKGSLDSGGYNLIGVNNSGTITGDTTGNLVSADPALPVDPVLDILQKDGYQTATHALLPGSPAINAGNPAGCTDWHNDLIAVDQRGEPRPQSVICDMGAYEAPDACFNGYQDTGERGVDCGGTCNPCSCGKDPVTILGGAAGTATGIQEGFTQAQSGDELRVLEHVFNSTDVVLSSFTSKAVTIKGGYNCDFNNNIGYYSTVDGMFEIGQNAAVTIENIVIK